MSGSVRLRLLVLALAPLVLLLPFLLFLGMTRWTADYDELLISKVDSDLRIAEQYLARIMTATGNELKGVAESAAFATILQEGAHAQQTYFGERRNALNLGFPLLSASRKKQRHRPGAGQSSKAALQGRHQPRSISFRVRTCAVWIRPWQHEHA